MLVENKDDHYLVTMNHIVTVGKDHPLEHFKAYLQDMLKEFDSKLTTKLYQIIREAPDGA